MSVRLLNPDNLAPPQGYTHAVVGRGTPVILAGQIGCDETGRVEAPRNLVKQFARALDNMLVALRAAGGVPEDVAQMRIFVTDVATYRASLRELGAVWRERFGRHYPAITLAEVKELFDAGARVEIEGMAFVETPVPSAEGLADEPDG